MGFIGTITADGVSVERGAATDALDATYLQDAIEDQRGHIGQVPGSGDILGTCLYNGTRYAWRNNAGGTAADMFRSTPAGWEQVDTGHRITFGSGAVFPDSFDSGFDTGFSYADEMAVGDKLLGETSGATCVVNSFHFLSGSLTDGTAAAEVYFTEHEGTFVVGEQIRAVRVATNGIGTITEANVDVAFSPNGKFEFDIYNYGGHASTTKLYGVNGLDRAFLFDGTKGEFIFTGMTDDAPTHLISHKKHLFLMFQGGSVQHSALGTPNSFSAILGASELGLGDEGVGFKKVPGGLLAIFTRNKTYILSGTSVADWALAEHSEESGAIEWSIQRLASPIYLDDRGLTTLNAVQEFGNFKDNVISDLFQPTLDTRTDKVLTSMVVREKSQYRLFFSDSSAIYCTFKNHKLIGATTIALGKKVTAAWSGEDSTGEEILLFGSTDGYLYQLDSGTSLDGAALISSFRVPYHHYGSPGYNKRFFSVVLEMDLQDPLSTPLTLFPDFTFSSSDAPKAMASSIDPGPGGGMWGSSEWGSFSWGGGLVGEVMAHIDGHGRNMGILITASSTYGKPHTVSGMTIEFAQRNRRR